MTVARRSAWAAAAASALAIAGVLLASTGAVHTIPPTEVAGVIILLVGAIASAGAALAGLLMWLLGKRNDRAIPLMAGGLAFFLTLLAFVLAHG